ncbi:MAG: LytTR family DNA-binding domain-containing protein [Bacteroidia bacterium]|jgi:two-component system LytT family response regulator|nr:LytTR family DNA-binding domain-containing protein [Bacteroidia bacterium]
MTIESIRAVLIDDEPKMLDVLSKMLALHCPDITIESTYTSPVEALKQINEVNPDVVFLDIQMPELTGFEFLEKAGVHSFRVIFTTAYDDYAVQAFRVNALDYLLKPIDSEELVQAASKLEKIIRPKPHDQFADFRQLQLAQSHFKLPVASSDGIKLVNLNQIIYLEADKNYTVFHFSDGKQFIASRNLAYFESQLPAYSFFRSHNSYMINLALVDRYIRGEGGFVEMSNGKQLEVSRKRKTELLQLLRIN